jgi:perosamine synthetase
MQVPIARTNLLEEEICSVLEPLKSGWLVQGKKVQEFEAKWSSFTNSKSSIAVTSCTTALHLSLAALGFGPGDEAIVPAFTWISTANVVEHLGGKVIFCDIDLETFNIDVIKLRSLIGPKTKAIIPVHLFGLSADMNPIMDLAKQHNLIVVEDAACGFGSRYMGQHVGTIGDAGAFSFHPRKAITTGEGGMITAQNEDLVEKLRSYRDHGASISDLQRHMGAKPYLLADHIYAGYNQRMTDIQAALGSMQMNRASEIVRERQRLASIYDNAFQGLSWLRTPSILEGYEHSYQSYPCLYLFDENTETGILKANEKRNQWMANLNNVGVSTRPATHAVHMLSYYREKYKLEPMDYQNAYIANHCSISLPLFHGMTHEEQQYVIKSVLGK